jgi:hypothetical protein
MDRLRDELKRTAREYEFKATLAGRRLVTAAYRYYGGYQQVCQDFGFGRPFTRIPRPLRTDPSRRLLYAHWSQRGVQLEVLRGHFAEELSWGYFPCVRQVKDQGFGGLAAHWLRTPEQWAGTAAGFSLLTYEAGGQQRQLALAMMEAIDRYEKFGRFPRATECSNKLRHRKFDLGISWGVFILNTDFHPRILERLQKHFFDHYHWCLKHQPDRCNFVHQALNGARTARQRREPFGRSSP